MNAEADYGEQGPEHFDRFGVRQHVTVTTNTRIRTYLDADPRGVVKRLGLTLRGWAKRWPGMEVFSLDVWGRPLQIRSYSDGRIKLFLDGEPVYTENIKVVTRHGVKYRETEIWRDPTVAEQEAETARQARHTATYDELKTRLKESCEEPL